jgi:hypothetical protein
MWNRVATLICLAVVTLGLGTKSAQASETRVQDVSFVCDGTARTVVITATNLATTPTTTTRFIQGYQIAFSDTSLQFLRLQLAGEPTKTFAVMGTGETSARQDYTGFFQVTLDGSGNVAFEVTATCKSKGATTLTGTVVIAFFS